MTPELYLNNMVNISETLADLWFRGVLIGCPDEVQNLGLLAFQLKDSQPTELRDAQQRSMDTSKPDT